MSWQFSWRFRRAWVVGLAAGAIVLWAASARAVVGEGGAAVATQAKSGVNVLMRGPIHEAFATQLIGSTKLGMVVPKKPPELIRETPPRIRPTGENIAWIPGYWGWDDTSKDYIWMSGLWRDVPPGRRWMPGYWAAADAGWRWYSGAWIRGDAQTVNYVPTPQASLERGPTSEPASDDQQWIPGSWVYQENAYQWRPGFWGQSAPGWCWIPDYYISTPRGAIYVDGYWDHGLERRGTLFAPVAISAAAALGAGFEYMPSEVLDASNLMLHLFARSDYHHYYFGDYYGDAFIQMGIRPWHEFRTVERGIDPLLTFYVRENARQGVDLIHELTGWHNYFLRNVAMRPPHLLSDLAGFVDRNKGVEFLNQAVLGQTLDRLAAAPGTAKNFTNVTAQELHALTGTVGSLAKLADLRMTTEVGASLGTAVGGVAGNTIGGTLGVGAQTHTVLKLPVVDQPLITAPVQEVVPNVLNAVPGVRRPEGVLPVVPDVQRVLPSTPPVVPLLPRGRLF